VRQTKRRRRKACGVGGVLLLHGGAVGQPGDVLDEVTEPGKQRSDFSGFDGSGGNVAAAAPSAPRSGGSGGGVERPCPGAPVEIGGALPSGADMAALAQSLSKRRYLRQ